MDVIDIIINTIKNITVYSILDIVVVSYIFYKIYMLMHDTRAEQLLKGILFIIILIPISSLLHLSSLNWILSKTLTIGVLSFIIIFQPEIRKALEHIGRSAFIDKHILDDDETINEVIGEIVDAVDALSKSRTGALIVIEQTTGIGDVINTGTKLDAIVSSQILENIFVVNTPLHDGATVIRNARIAAAGCFLPLTNNTDINKQLGTRHRSAIGVSEVSDALVIVVSEETGVISLATEGKLNRHYTKDRLRETLISITNNRRDMESNYKKKVKSWLKKKSNN